MALRLLSSLRPTVSFQRTLSSISQHQFHVTLSQSRQASSAGTKLEAQNQSPDTALNKDQREIPNLDSSLSLPEPVTSPNLHDNSGGVKLDHLGPVVVNRDGSLSRISNWAEMSDIERRNTLRILGKRNMLRLQNVKDKGSAE
jgi:hypothetical protein